MLTRPLCFHLVRIIFDNRLNKGGRRRRIRLVSLLDSVDSYSIITIFLSLINGRKHSLISYQDFNLDSSTSLREYTRGLRKKRKKKREEEKNFQSLLSKISSFLHFPRLIPSRKKVFRTLLDPPRETTVRYSVKIGKGRRNGSPARFHREWKWFGEI